MHLRVLLRVACCASFAVTLAVGQSSEPGAGSHATTLTGWLANRTNASQYEDWFVPHRNALLRAKSEKCDLVPQGGTMPPLYPLRPVVTALEAGMRRFAEASVAPPPDKAVEAMLAVAAAFRKQGDSLHPLLPYLLLLEKYDSSDPRIQFLLFEAWGTAALDWGAAKAAAAKLAGIVRPAAGESGKGAGKGKGGGEALASFVFEAASLGKDPNGTLVRLVDAVCQEHAAGNKPLGRRALGKAHLPELDRQYQEQMRQPDDAFAGARATLATMMELVPEDRVPALICAMAGGDGPARRKVRSESGSDFLTWYQGLDAAQREQADARLRRLGFEALAEGRDVARVVAALEDKKSIAFFDPSAQRSVEQKKSEIRSAWDRQRQNVDSAANLRNEANNLRRRADNIRRANGNDYESVWQGLLRDAERCDADAADRDTAAQRAAEDAQRAEGELPALEAQWRALQERRRAFRLG